MADNLLVNGGFEDGWYHAQEGDNRQIPNGWRLWYAGPDIANPVNSDDDNIFDAPECRHLLRTDVPEAERELFWADERSKYTYKLFADGAWWSALYQNLQLGAGRYAVSFFAWPDAHMGYDTNGNKIPAPDPLTMRWAVKAYGQNGSDSSPWQTMKPYLYPSDYGYILEIPQAGYYQVALHLMAAHAVASTAVFVDDCRLELVSLPAECRGAPRVQYKRVLNVLPIQATRAQAHAVLDEIFDRKESLGWSYDDAGVGNLDDRTAKLYGISAELQPEFVEFYATHYPGVTVNFFPIPGDKPTEPPAPALGEFLSLHRQTSVDGLLEYIETVKPAWVKLVSEIEFAKEIKASSPGTRVVYRDSRDRPPPDTLLDLARLHADYVDAIENENEVIATGDVDGTRESVRRAVAFSDALAALNLPVAACLLNVAVGNPGHDEVELLLPAAEAAVRNGHYMGYHPYFPANPQHAERWLIEEGKHHHLRALLSWDPVFADHGLAPRYLFTECGAIGASARSDGRPGGYLSAFAGWRDQDCLNGDRSRYLQLLLAWREQVVLWNIHHDNRAEGGMIFTIGADYVGWHNFKLWKAELTALAEALT